MKHGTKADRHCSFGSRTPWRSLRLGERSSDSYREFGGDVHGGVKKTEAVTVVQATAQTLSQAERDEIIRLCAEAYEEDFSGFFQTMPETTHLLGRVDGRLVSHLAWVTRWLQPAGCRLLETAYIEAVATAPADQGKGYASLLLRAAVERIQDYDLGALSPSDAGFYERLGWELWRGRLGVRTAEGIEPTPAGEEVMVIRLRKTPELDLDAFLTAEWREGELW